MASVLILEDDEDLRELLVDTLADQGHEASGVGRGEEAIQRLQETAIDLLIVDIRMAGPDGLETVAYLRRLGIGVATLVMTGYADQSDPIRALRLGVKDYLMKPFALDEFLWTVERLLDERRQTVQHQQLQTDLQSSLDWLLEHALEPPAPGFPAALGSSREVVGRLQLSALEHMQLQLALYLRARADRRELSERAPSPLREALQGWEAGWEGSSWLARLGALTEALTAEVSEGELVRLQKSQPGRFDPYLTEQLLLGLKPASTPAEAARLLELVHILLACGDRDASHKAFQRLLQALPEASPERIFARLGLAALGGGASHEHLLALFDDLDRLAPAQAAAGLWDSARWLLRWQRPELVPLLKKLAAQLQNQGARTALAQLGVLAWALEPAALPNLPHSLQQLMLPENQAMLHGSLDWLLPRLLEASPGDSQLAALASRLARQNPQVLSVALRQNRLSSPARCFLAQALAGLGSARETMQQLREDPDPQVRELARQAGAQADSGETHIPVQVLTFGGFELWVGSSRVPESAWRGSRVKHLAAYVALSPKPVPAERLLDLFWPDGDERSRRGLQSALSVIRTACRNFEGVEGRSILSREAECVLLPEPFRRWVDCHEFDSLLRQAAQSSGLEQRCSLLQRAVTLYKGPFLEGCFLDWAIDLQNTYEQLALRALLDLCEGELSLQRWSSVLHNASHALRLDPFHLGAARAVVKAHLGPGHTEKALQFFESFQRRYQEETGQGLTMDQFF